MEILVEFARQEVFFENDLVHFHVVCPGDLSAADGWAKAL
jgi:hypothetical protein